MKDKNSQKTHENEMPFKPTLSMVYFWKAYADPMTKADLASVSRKAVAMMREDGVSEDDIPEAESIRRMTYEWESEDEYKDSKRYLEWKKENWEKLMKSKEQLLDKIGIQRSTKDFRYWKGMQEKYMGLKKKIDITTNDKDINSTEQIANLLQETLKSGDSPKKENRGDNKAKSKKGEVSQSSNS